MERQLEMVHDIVNLAGNFCDKYHDTALNSQGKDK